MNLDEIYIRGGLTSFAAADLVRASGSEEEEGGEGEEEDWEEEEEEESCTYV